MRRALIEQADLVSEMRPEASLQGAGREGAERRGVLMSTHHRCPALFISAPASGHGKTTITAALARLYRRQGKRVRVFKTGPDFLDPMVLEQASGQPVVNLDLWLGGEDHCRRQVALAAAEADVLLVEGVMGLYDGEPSSADLAQLLGIPVVAVINARGMGQTIGALAQGLLAYRPELKFAGVLANGVASPRHAQMLRQGLQNARPSVPLLTGLQRDMQFALPERHLGLVAAPEIADLDARLDAVAESMSSTSLANAAGPVDFGTPRRNALPAPVGRQDHCRGARPGVFLHLHRQPRPAAQMGASRRLLLAAGR
jgi:cobyrinic acid a,c-diamide synthase